MKNLLFSLSKCTRFMQFTLKWTKCYSLEGLRSQNAVGNTDTVYYEIVLIVVYNIQYKHSLQIKNNNSKKKTYSLNISNNPSDPADFSNHRLLSGPAPAKQLSLMWTRSLKNNFLLVLDPFSAQHCCSFSRM